MSLRARSSAWGRSSLQPPLPVFGSPPPPSALGGFPQHGLAGGVVSSMSPPRGSGGAMSVSPPPRGLGGGVKPIPLPLCDLGGVMPPWPPKYGKGGVMSLSPPSGGSAGVMSQSLRLYGFDGVEPTPPPPCLLVGVMPLSPPPPHDLDGVVSLSLSSGLRRVTSLSPRLCSVGGVRLPCDLGGVMPPLPPSSGSGGVLPVSPPSGGSAGVVQVPQSVLSWMLGGVESNPPSLRDLPLPDGVVGVVSMSPSFGLKGVMLLSLPLCGVGGVVAPSPPSSGLGGVLPRRLPPPPP
jgi:hypothetical protein